MHGETLKFCYHVQDTVSKLIINNNIFVYFDTLYL